LPEVIWAADVHFLLFAEVTSFFFFQAEDGIRDSSVTGVQTCALPIYAFRYSRIASSKRPCCVRTIARLWRNSAFSGLIATAWRRSEERRVGKECRSGGGGYE